MPQFQRVQVGGQLLRYQYPNSILVLDFNFSVLQCLGQFIGNVALHRCHVSDFLVDSSYHIRRSYYSIPLCVVSQAR